MCVAVFDVQFCCIRPPFGGVLSYTLWYTCRIRKNLRIEYVTFSHVSVSPKVVYADTQIQTASVVCFER